MLFLHNGGSGHWVWQHQVQHFAKDYHVFAFDMLGCGASDRPNTTYDLDFYAQMTNDIMKKLNLQNVILVGNCVGAAASLEYASLDSSRVKALILFNLCGGHDMMSPLVRWVSTPMPKPLQHVQKKALKVFRRIPGMVASAVRTNFAGKPNPKDPVFIAETIEANNPKQSDSRLNLMNGLSSFNKFSSKFVRPESLPPVLVFWGQENRVLPVSKGLRFCERLQPTKTHTINGAGHLLMAEQPSLVNAYIETFLNDLVIQPINS